MPGPITKIGYNTTTYSLTTLKGHVASEISKHYQIPTGIIRQGESTVCGGFSGFTRGPSNFLNRPGAVHNTLWSIVEGESDTWTLVRGVRLVNVLGFVATEPHAAPMYGGSWGLSLANDQKKFRVEIINIRAMNV